MDRTCIDKPIMDIIDGHEIVAIEKHINNENGTYGWGILQEGEVVATLVTQSDPESKSLNIIEFWVKDEFCGEGIGQELLALAKEQMRRERRKVLRLKLSEADPEKGTTFHQSMDGITENIWYPTARKRLQSQDLEIRMETPEEWHDVEEMTQRAFWNNHHLGCDEHYLVHKLRQSSDYLPSLSRIALLDGKIIGCIMYSKARVVQEEKIHEIVTFGPLCVAPEWQGCGVGEHLLKETMEIAAKAGYKGIVIFGEPEYYPLIGFKTCDHFNITTADGRNFNAFMGIELKKDSMKHITGKFYESDIFENLPKEEVEEYNKNFPTLRKLRFPGQWD